MRVKIKMKILVTIAISALTAYATMFGVYNYLPVNYLAIESTGALGATITNIAASDKLKDSRSVINTNFTNLNNNKIEMSTTSVASIITLSNLVTVGTIGTGVWEGTDVTVANGGTGLSTLTANAVMLGAGSSNVNFVSGLGSSGQFLTSQGASSDPTWTTSAVSLSDDYIWTGYHTFTSAFFTIASTTNATSTNFDITGLFTIGGDIINEFAGNGLVVTNNQLNTVKYTLVQTTDIVASGEGTLAFATSTGIAVPANTLNASSTVTVHGSVTCTETGSNGGSCSVHLRDSTGAGFVSCVIETTNSDTRRASFTIHMFNNNSVTSQTTICGGLQVAGGMTTVTGVDDENTSTIDTSATIEFFIVLEGNGANAIISNFVIEINP